MTWRMTFSLSLSNMILDIEIEYYQIMSTIVQLQHKNTLRSFAEQEKTNLQNTSNLRHQTVGVAA